MNNTTYETIDCEGNHIFCVPCTDGKSFVRSSGRNRTVALPKEYGITNIAARAFAPQNSWRNACPFKVFPEISEPLCGEKVEAVVLPNGVSTIGDYAFYDCRRFRHLTLTDDVQRIGNNAFLNCESLTYITIYLHHDVPTCLYTVFSEIQNKITLDLHFTDTNEQARLIFPSYFEEAVENAPARIFEYHTYGTGLRYRQCLPKGKVDFRAYDLCFPFACVEEEKKLLYDLIFTRLEYPYALSEQNKDIYLRYLTENAVDFFEIAMAEDNIDRAMYILNLKSINREDYIRLTEKTAWQKRPAFAAILHEYGRSFEHRRKNLEL